MRHFSIAFQLYLAIIPLLFLGMLPDQLRAEGEDLHVFIMHSYHQEYPWTKLENDGFVSRLTERLPDRNVSFSVEYLDTKRVLSTPDYQRFFHGYLKEKYRGYTPDIVFSTDDNSLRFLNTFNESLFKGVPRVFCGVNDLSVADRIENIPVTGVFEVKDIERNINLFSRLFPSMETILVVGDDSPTYKVIQTDIQQFTKRKKPRFSFEYVADKNLKTVIDTLTSKKKGIILLTTIGGFHAGNTDGVPLQKVIQHIRESGDFVLGSMEDVYMLEGVFGGIVTSGEKQGATAADIAAGILAEKILPATYPAQQAPNTPLFDYRELQRLHIQLSSLPEGAVILNRPFSLYEEYKEFIWGVTALICFLFISLGILSLNVVRRKNAENALAESEQFLESVIENIPDIVFVKRAEDLRFVRFNKAGADLAGVSPKDMIGKNDYDFFQAEEADFSTRKDREVLEGRKLIDIPEESIETPAGTRYLHTKKMPLMDKSGTPAFLLGIARDITAERADRVQRKQLEQRLQQAEKMESIGTLAGGIAHDFNNILSSIIGYIELAQLEVKGDGTEKLEKFLGGALKGANRVKKLIRQILTFSRKGEPQRIPRDPAVIVTDALQFLRFSLPSTIAIESDVEPGSTILCDPTQIHQVILNLCTNGYQAMLEKGGKLGVSLKRVDIGAGEGIYPRDIPAGRYVRFEVSDTGCGMDEDTKQRMFDPYFTTKGVDTGTGLGLSVVHGIIENHDGFIHVYSEKGHGTKIHAYFPLCEDDSQALPEEVQEEAGKGGDEHILLVDDEEDLCQMTVHLLERFGYRVTSFSDSLKALEAVQRAPDGFDLLITDMTMPNLTGTELAGKVLDIVPSMPIILCTGHSELINRRLAMSMGIREYCEKPVPLEQLLQSIRKVLDGDSHP